MTDRKIHERLTGVDRIPVPDMWADATTRTPGRPAGDAPRPGTRWAAATLALVVCSLAAFGLWQAVGGDEPPAVDEPAPPAIDTLAALAEGWTDLGSMPRVPTGTTIWTGRELISWGGGGEEGPGPLRGDGFRFDPISGAIATIPAAPIEPRADPAYVWTGQELLIWGGWREGPPYFDDGAAYDPATDTWRRLPAAPISARVPLSAWTGTEWIVWGTAVRVDDRPLDGAAYDPATDSWRPIATGPTEFTDATAMWTGREFVVVGAALHGGNFPETETAIAAAYDPATDTWRELASSPLNPNSNVSVWTGDRIVGVDYDHVTASYDPESGAWIDMGPFPGQECEGGLGRSRAAGGWALVSDCGTVGVLPPGETTWAVPVDAPPAYYAQTVSAGEAVIVFVQPPGGGQVHPWVFRPYADPASMETLFFPTSSGGAVTDMPVTFPDGATATLRFPYYYEVDTLGVFPRVSWLWLDDPSPRYEIEFVHGAIESVTSLVGEQPIGTLEDASGGSVPLWRMDAEGEAIVFELPEWTVIVPTGGFEPSAVALAFAVTQDEKRSPVVSAEPPFALSEETGEGGSARLSLDGQVKIILEPGTCDPGYFEVDTGWVLTCGADGQVNVSVFSEWPSYTREIAEALEVRDFVPGP